MGWIHSCRAPTGQEKDRKKHSFFKSQEKVWKFHCESGIFGILSKVRKRLGKIKSKWKVCMMSQVKSKNDVCSQDMYGYGSLLVLITPFIEYVLKVTKPFLVIQKLSAKFIN